MREHHVLDRTGLAAEGCPPRHDVAAIVRGGGLPEHVRLQVEGRKGVGRVREPRPQRITAGRARGDAGARLVRQSSGQPAAGMLPRPWSDQPSAALSRQVSNQPHRLGSVRRIGRPSGARSV